MENYLFALEIVYKIAAIATPLIMFFIFWYSDHDRVVAKKARRGLTHLLSGMVSGGHQNVGFNKKSESYSEVERQIFDLLSKANISSHTYTFDMAGRESIVIDISSDIFKKLKNVYFNNVDNPNRSKAKKILEKHINKMLQDRWSKIG